MSGVLCVHICACVSICACKCEGVYVCLCMWVYMCRCVCVCGCTCVCVCVYVGVHVDMPFLCLGWMMTSCSEFESCTWHINTYCVNKIDVPVLEMV